MNNSYFKTLPENEKTVVLSKSENNKLVLNKFATKRNKLLPLYFIFNIKNKYKIMHKKINHIILNLILKIQKMNDSQTNIVSTIIDLAIENLITNTTNKNLPETGPTLKQINRNNLNFKTLIAIILLLIYIISAPIFVKIKFYLLHQSGLCMLLGMIISLITHFITPFENYKKSLEFNDNVFFTFILPPIIFSAGYNIRVKSFFRYFHYSVIFGILGTFMTFLIIFFSTYFFNKINLFQINFNIKDILLYSAVISSLIQYLLWHLYQKQIKINYLKFYLEKEL